MSNNHIRSLSDFFCLVKSSLGTRLIVQWDKALTCSTKGGWTYSLYTPFIRSSLEVGWLIRLHCINKLYWTSHRAHQAVRVTCAFITISSCMKSSSLASQTQLGLARETRNQVRWDFLLVVLRICADGVITENTRCWESSGASNSRTRYWCTELLKQSLVVWAPP